MKQKPLHEANARYVILIDRSYFLPNRKHKTLKLIKVFIFLEKIRNFSVTKIPESFTKEFKVTE